MLDQFYGLSQIGECDRFDLGSPTTGTYIDVGKWALKTFIQGAPEIM
jgi:hypothetical protein